MNTLMQQTAKFLPQTLVKGLPSVSRGFSFSNSLLWLSEDQAWREAKNAKQYAYQKKKMADPSWKEATLKRMRLFHRQRYQDKEFSGRKRFRNWLTNHCKGPLREGLVWKTHVPILYKDKVKHTCVGCGYPPRGGLKLWWQQISDPSQFRCHLCYCSPDVSKAVPVGYEDMVFGQKAKSRSNPSGAEVPDSLPGSTKIDTGPHTAKEHAENEKKST